MKEQIFDAIALALAGMTVFWVGSHIKRMIKLNSLFNNGMVLIPLYLKKTGFIALNTILLFFTAASIVTAIASDRYILFGCAALICLCLIALVSIILASRFAVLDCGIIVPFRFIDYMHLYDYRIEDNTIFFFRDEKGFDALSAVTPKLRFPEEHLPKLEYLLKKHININ